MSYTFTHASAAGPMQAKSGKKKSGGKKWRKNKKARLFDYLDDDDDETNMAIRNYVKYG